MKFDKRDGSCKANVGTIELHVNAKKGRHLAQENDNNEEKNEVSDTDENEC